MDNTFVETVVTAFSSAVNDAMTLFATLLPIGLGVFAATWLVRKGMAFFRTSTRA